ncbi:DNA/RNA non-specific endonuclease [Flavilitoribacter nigricans]|uniref:Endonuclease n=1 Tax=Flavilitoribacter nigricans (strain ATCC 23147 / DSM 23189 / NBRC 102662 / NCIMB 1420 / SS-2) TaxID=1122177 RepID=A0A2D0NIU0_FLAN2|nr:DNA/RNA non-specific endonuclease [Flavilitoribacter nigricans]PHN08411.1 DNA/RNA endonuclease [Flavilitoribacter nigricans DSM 23189 = NBRC 102662]
MAKLRTNHARQAKGSSGMIVKVGLFGAIIGGLYFVFNYFTGADLTPPDTGETYHAESYYLPSSTGQVIEYRDYVISYNEDHEQAEWVAYILTRENLEKPWNKRSDNFMPDSRVKTGSATPNDYRGSGYDRGHLVPAADMAYDAAAMEETFLMSNISPQSRNFNKGIWRELEELTRDWAKKFDELYVVTGPVLSQEPKGYIGENEVSVPTAYFKVLLDLAEPEQKGIGFIIPNQVSFEPLYDFVASIDQVEELTGIDFYPDLMPKELEQQLEGNYNLDLWQFSKQKYDKRIEQWNKE